jgi:hypothetical protein
MSVPLNHIASLHVRALFLTVLDLNILGVRVFSLYENSREKDT